MGVFSAITDKWFNKPSQKIYEQASNLTKIARISSLSCSGETLIKICPEMVTSTTIKEFSSIMSAASIAYCIVGLSHSEYSDIVKEKISNSIFESIKQDEELDTRLCLECIDAVKDIIQVPATPEEGLIILTYLYGKWIFLKNLGRMPVSDADTKSCCALGELAIMPFWGWWVN